MEQIHPLWFVAASSGIALFPLVVGLCTSYVKISVVFGMLKSGLGTQQVPSTMLVMLLSLVLSLYIMAPVLQEVQARVESVNIGDLETRPKKDSVAQIRLVLEPLFAFMQLHSGTRELQVLDRLAPKNPEFHKNKKGDATVSLYVLIPAFVLTELKEAFSMGFVLLLPFLVIDLIVANILVGLGMFMVSPVMIALPLKLLVFILADGWLLLSQGLIRSYGG